MLSQKISCLRDSTAVYRSFVNENAFFQAIIDDFSLFYVFKALLTDASIVNYSATHCKGPIVYYVLGGGGGGRCFLRGGNFFK